MDEIKAILKRGGFVHGTDAKIEVTLPEGGMLHLFDWKTDPSFEYRCHQMSPNERKTVIAQCEKQIDEYKVGDCPTEYRKLLQRLKEIS